MQQLRRHQKIKIIQNEGHIMTKQYLLWVDDRFFFPNHIRERDLSRTMTTELRAHPPMQNTKTPKRNFCVYLSFFRFISWNVDYICKPWPLSDMALLWVLDIVLVTWTFKKGFKPFFNLLQRQGADTKSLYITIYDMYMKYFKEPNYTVNDFLKSERKKET